MAGRKRGPNSRIKNSYAEALSITFDGEYAERLAKFGSALPAIMNFSMGDVAHDMMTYIREKFLTGQILDRKTGVTQESVWAYQPKYANKQFWNVAPGVGIKRHSKPGGVQRGRQGGLAYLARWSGTDKDFMRIGAESYGASGRYMGLIDENLERMGRRLEVM